MLFLIACCRGCTVKTLIHIKSKSNTDVVHHAVKARSVVIKFYHNKLYQVSLPGQILTSPSNFAIDFSRRSQKDEAQQKFSRHTKVMPPKRAVFSDYQRRQLELEFIAHKYISKQERRLLAKRLELSESQVRIWFQNRRMKWRNRQEREMMRRQRLNPLKS